MADAPSAWSVDRVCSWLGDNGLSHLDACFRRNRIDGRALLSLTKADLRDELCIEALGDRKALWDSLEVLSRRRSSAAGLSSFDRAVSSSPVPVVSTYASPSPSASGDRCEHCYKLFGVSDVPILLTLPGASRAAQLHSYCKEAWARRHAKQCAYCFEPMTTKITTLSGSFGKVELHPECEHLWTSANAKKCQHCGLAMTGDVTTLTGSFGKVDVHPECVVAFERSMQNGGRQSPRSVSPRSTSPRLSSPRLVGVAPNGRCEECYKPFESYDKPILFTLPGATRAAELHPHCKTAWSKRHAKMCDFCREPMVLDITTLSGAWGSAQLHPDCVPAYERSKGVHSVRRGSNASTTDRCNHCHRTFKDGEIAAVVTLPGGTATAKLHPGCRNEWSMLHAKLCDHCSKPMPTDVTTLTGAWGSVEIHPTCVLAFKETLAAGHPVRAAPPSPGSYGRRSTSPGRSPRRLSSGYGPGVLGGSAPASPTRCYQCGISFLPSESISILTVEDLDHSVHLHDRCIDTFHRRLGHVCSWCDGTITGHMTKLKGNFGSATLHPDCLLAFKAAKHIT